MSAIAERRTFANMAARRHSREALKSLHTHRRVPPQQRSRRPGECCTDGRTVVYCGAWTGSGTAFATWPTSPPVRGPHSRPGWPSWSASRPCCTRRQYQRAKEQTAELMQPTVAMFMEPSATDWHLVELVVKNFGRTPAYGIRFEFANPPTVGKYENSYKDQYVDSCR